MFRSSAPLHLLLLVALCGGLYFPYLGGTPFFDKGEPREALAVQDIVRRGEWLFPLKGAGVIPSKPPLFHWSAALAYQFTGTLDEATIRFPSAFYATLGVLLLYLLGRKLYGGEVGLLAAAMLATAMVYINQALSARVDMTLCFFVTASLILFYALYKNDLRHRLWYFVLYAVVGVGAMAKGPLGIVLPGLVIAIFLAAKKRWDLFAKFAFHPGVLLAALLAGGWYGLTISRGGEGFVDRQLLGENVGRFFGGSGHSHPVYYYLPYLFALGLPWSIFLPFALWDFLKGRSLADDDKLFPMNWFLVMFIFFSASLGKRPVYLLPLFPAISLLVAVWLWHAQAARGARLLFFRAIAIFAGASGLMLLLIAAGDLWNHNPAWFFSPIESLLKPKDRANFEVIKADLANFGWRFDAAASAAGVLWLVVGFFLWRSRLRQTALGLLLTAVVLASVGRAFVVPKIAESKSYRDFVEEVNRRVKPGEKLYVYGSFNTDPVFFYRGATIDELPEPFRAGAGESYVIMDEGSWKKMRRANPDLPAPLLVSRGTGPEGDARLVLVRVDVS